MSIGIMNKNIFLMFCFGLLLINLSSASIGDLGNFRPKECVMLKQTCQNCSFNTISDLSFPDSKTGLTNVNMSSVDHIYYNYSFCNNYQIGIYNVQGYGDDNFKQSNWAYTYSISFWSLTLFIIVLLVNLGVIIFGIVYEDVNILAFGNIITYFIGIFTLIYGIDIYRTTVTTAFGCVMLGIGFYLSYRVYEGYTN